MFFAYWSRSPWAPVLFILSLPAKSTKFSFDPIYLRFYSGKDKSADSTYSINSKWEREESLFIAVSPTDLFLFPMFIKFINSSWDFAGFDDKSLINTPLSGLYFIYKLFFTSFPSKSLTYSLYISIKEHLIKNYLFFV